MREITLEELLEAGCHFGHQVTRSNTKARDYIFEARDNIHIIDLAKTKEGLEEAANFIKKLSSNGGSLLIVGTKRQAKGIIEEEIQRALNLFEESTRDQSSEVQKEPLLFYVISRWIGGILTNFSEVSKNIKKLKDLTAFLQNEEEKAKYTKKEIGLFGKEREKLQNFYGGILEMKKRPDALFIIDTHLENLAVREANAMDLKTVGITDTNADPTMIDYPIPANDDAVGSLKLIVSYIMDAWIEGKKNLELKEADVEKKAGIKNQKTEDIEKKTKELKTSKTTKEAKAKSAEKEEKDVKRQSRTVKKTA